MNKKFYVELSSDLDYEDMIADIYYKDYIVAKVIQEKDIDHMEVIFYKHMFDDGDTCLFSLNDFLDVLQKAKKILTEAQKLPE